MAIIPEVLGDWCDRCADAGDPNPVRFPHRVERDGVAHYHCDRCGSDWTCWWAIDTETLTAVGM